MKKNEELSLVELQRILLARCNNIVSARAITEFSMGRVLAFSKERVLAQNTLQLTRNFGVPLAFLQRSICVPVTHSLLGYFCPVLYMYTQK